VVVLGYGQCQPGLAAPGAAAGALRAFHDVPAVVFTTLGTRRLNIDLLEPILADIRDIQVAGLPVEGNSPGVAQAERPDLVPNRLVAGKRVVGRNCVSPAHRIHVDPNEFAEQCAAVLGVVIGIERTTAVAETEVQHAVRPEPYTAAIVVIKRLGHDQQDFLAVRIGDIRVFGHLEPRKHHTAARAREPDVKVTSVLIVRGEGGAQQTLLLSEVRDPALDVKENAGPLPVLVQDKNRAGLPDKK
jgi:hypothetical protein